MGAPNICRLIAQAADNEGFATTIPNAVNPIVLGAGGMTVPGPLTIAAAGTLVRTGVAIQQSASRAKIGTTAGFVITGLNTAAIATMAQSQTAGTLSLYLDLKVGDIITGYKVYSSINSAGGAVTLDAALRTGTIAAGATATDAAVASGSITQVAVTAATASTATVTGLSTTVAAGVGYYILLTGTTAASTTIEINQVEVIVTTQ